MDRAPIQVTGALVAQPVSNLQDATPALLERAAHLLGVPQDRPRFGPVLAAIATAIVHLAPELAGAEDVAESLARLAPKAEHMAAPGAARNSLSKRRGRHLLYALLVELSERIEAKLALDTQALRIVAAWSLRALLSGWLPTPEPVAKVRAILVRPDSSAARSWSSRGRRRCLELALSSLELCMARNPQATRDLGLRVSIAPESRKRPANPS
jgi:hypothetical protein